MKRNRPRLALGDCVLQVLAAEKDEKGGDAAAVARPGATQGQWIALREFDRHVPTLNGVSGLLRGERRGREAPSLGTVQAATMTADELLIREGLTRG